MSINIQDERLLTFSEAAEYLPQGHRPTKPTWWRWWRYGLYGVKLETVVVGRSRYTTAEAVMRFAAQLTDRGGRSVAADAEVPAHSEVPVAQPSHVGTEVDCKNC